MSCSRLRPFAQNYDWGKLGHDSAVARLVEAGNHGVVIDSAKPYAELWMGDHPNGPCFVHDGNAEIPIWHYLKSRDSKPMPFLFKVLSVGKALSIQSHPDAVLAKQLHAKFPHIYKDPNPKPELAIALTKFKALFGFRPVGEIAAFMKQYPALAELVGPSAVAALNASEPGAIKKAYSALMTASPEKIAATVSAVCQSEANELACELNKQYPGGDVGVLSVFFLNVVDLAPGECLFMGPNVPHAYLSGDIIECMTSSDNVIRGGLTPKFKDIPTLLSSLDFTSTDRHTRLAPTGGSRWAPPGVPFAVTKYDLNDKVVELEQSSAPSIILVTRGAGHIDNLAVHEGSVVLIDANDKTTVTSRHDISLYHAFDPSN